MFVSQSTEFRSISKEQLCTYISEESLKTSNGEIDVFRATLKWYEGNPSADTGKESDLVDLMQHVRFPLIPTDLLLDEIQSSRLVYENSQVMRMVTEALRFHSNDKVYLQPLKEGKQFQPRGEQKLALIQITPSNTVHVTKPNTKLHLLDMTGEEIFDTQFSEQSLQRVFHPCTLSMVAKGNYLFIFGAVTDSNRTIATRFDVKTNAWLDLRTPPLGALTGIAATSLNGNIYLLGGAQQRKDSQNIPRNIVSMSALQYAIETNTWAPLENLPRGLVHHSAASHGNYVFCAGGNSNEPNVSNKLCAFDIVGRIWLSKASMNCPRIMFSMEALGPKLVACGGKHSPNVEIYDIAEDQWTLIQNMVLLNHYFPATIVLNDKVYVIGGIAVNVDGTTPATDCVSCVDVENCTIQTVSSLPFEVSHPACALLKVPATGDRSQNDN